MLLEKSGFWLLFPINPHRYIVISAGYQALEEHRKP